MRLIHLLTITSLMFLFSACQPATPEPASEEVIDEITITDIRETMIEQQARDLPTFVTFEEIASHNEQKDCWMQVETRAYDLSPLFLAATPSAQILELCGSDASAAFRDGLLGLNLADFYVGDLLLEE